MTPAIALTAAGIALPYNGIHTTHYAIALIALFVACVFHAFNRHAPGEWTFGPAGLVMLLLLGWVAASTAWSLVPYLSVIYTGLLVAAIIGYLVLRTGAGSASVRKTWAVVLPMFGLAFASWLAAQILTGVRPEGPFLNINTAGAFLNLIWPLPAAIALAHGRARKGALMWLTITGLLVLAAGTSGGRAVTLAMAAAFVVVVLGSAPWASRRRLVAFIATMIVALACAQWVSQWAPNANVRGLGERMVSLTDPGAAGASRLRIWSSTLDMIGERPWLGWGPGTFYQAYPAFRAGEDGSAGQHAHNDYLQYWAEAGIPALVLVLLLGAICTWLFWRGMRHGPTDTAHRVMRVAGGAAVAGAGVHALFSYNLQVLAYLIVLGVAIGALEVGSGCRPMLRIPLEPIRRRPLPAMGFILLLAIPITYLSTMAASAHYTNRGAAALALGHYEDADDELATAARLWRMQDLARGLRADAYRRALESLEETEADRRRTLKQRGLELAEQAAARNPLRPLHQLTKGRLLLQPPDADPAAAEQAYRRALELNPRTAEARVALARLLLNQGRDEAALAAVEAGFNRHYGARNNPAQLLRLGVELRENAGDHAGADRLRDQLAAIQARAASRISMPPDAAEYGR